MKLYLLDMGSKLYGDCILAVEGHRSILIDGGHIGDWQASGDTLSIPDQLAAILGTDKLKIDLLVVTHCHGDHIGCLPKLVEDDVVAFEWALVADEKLGFPVSSQDAAADAETAKVVAGMREEPQPQLAGAALDEFLTDAVKLPQRYADMLAALKRKGTKVIRYNDRGDATRVENAFADFGLKVLGPTTAHLKKCRDAIVRFSRDVHDAVDSLRSADSALNAGAVYRILAGGRPPVDAHIPDSIRAFLDRAGKGAALNDQSIILRLGKDGEASLLTGDMQLALPEISGLDDDMSELLDVIRDAGPYKFVKLPHHASYNGFDEAVLQVLEQTPAFGISTGSGDPGHPEAGVLELLESVSASHQWARTDRNGLISVSFRNGKVKLDIARGELSDPRPNTSDAMVPEDVEAELEALAKEPPRARRLATISSSDRVEIIARIPHVKTKVTITVEVDPEEIKFEPGKPPSSPPSERRKPQPSPDILDKLASGRSLPRLLFVTNSSRLAANIGQMEASDALTVIRNAGQALVDLDGSTDPYGALREQARIAGDIKGVVILGGYDVVRSERYDVLPPSLRARIGPSAYEDPDGFIVWSDQIYGDLDNDGLADVPVSRIPDGRSASLVRTALCGCSANPGPQRFGLRNYERPFADAVFAGGLVGSEDILTSRQTRSQQVLPDSVNADNVYLMLHGSDEDTTRFWGEAAGGMLEALHTTNVPDRCGAVVLAGCCWGALIVRTRASHYRDGDQLQALTPEQSLALTFLDRGAVAFVGCTGAHYSPIEGDLNYFGAPMHHRFWHHLAQGKAPASALFEAKVDYIAGMPHGKTKIEEVAIENKILRQFTCLGLGW